MFGNDDVHYRKWSLLFDADLLSGHKLLFCSVLGGTYFQRYNSSLNEAGTLRSIVIILLFYMHGVSCIALL